MVAALQALIEEIRENYHARGIAVAAVDREGHTLYESFTGYRDEAQKLPMDEDTIFGLASISKSFTTICALQLCEAGVISLDDPVHMHLPYYQGRVAGEPVRIRHLLSHSGGYFPLKRTCIQPVAELLQVSGDDVELAAHEGLAVKGAEIVAAQMDAQQPHLGRPGQYMSYCNDGFGLVSEIIRLKGGEKSYADYVEKHVLKPLHMERSCATYAFAKTMDNVSLLYSQEDGVVHADLDFTRWAFVLGGGGALKSTLADFKRYLGCYLGGHEGIISEASLSEMMRPRVYHQPGCDYGYGLFIKDFCGSRMAYHDGSLPGVSSYFAVCPEAGFGVVVLCNTEDVPVYAIGEGVMSVLMGGEARVPKRPYEEASADPVMLAEAAGEYATEEGNAFAILKEASGFVFLKGGQREPLKVTGARQLLKEEVYRDVPIDFWLDDRGQIFAAKYGGRTFRKIN